ncbi:MAG: N-acetyl-gamma-glutamyl-phosphate reductase [Parachlamydiaceae bacterium]
MIRVGIIGATGYIGIELVRILLNHPEVELTYLTAQTHSGEKIDSIYPHIRMMGDLPCSPFDIDVAISSCDIIFTALHHGHATHFAEQMINAGKKLIDFSADFRLKNPSSYEYWYHQPAANQKLLDTAVYGLPELVSREKIRNASLIANPGCYSSCAMLGAMPAIAANIVDLDHMIFDGKSGISGAGRSLALTSHFCEVAENFKAYAIAGEHRHTPEIEQGLSEIAGKPLHIQFTPHLIPMVRGLLVTSYFHLLDDKYTEEMIWNIYADAYANETFIRVLPLGQLPQTADVRASNYCDIGLRVDLRTKKLIVISAIDNLIKGAVGSAVQNMNLIYQIPETTALSSLFSPYP